MQLCMTYPSRRTQGRAPPCAGGLGDESRCSRRRDSVSVMDALDPLLVADGNWRPRPPAALRSVHSQRQRPVRRCAHMCRVHARLGLRAERRAQVRPSRRERRRRPRPRSRGGPGRPADVARPSQTEREALRSDLPKAARHPRPTGARRPAGASGRSTSRRAHDPQAPHDDCPTIG